MSGISFLSNNLIDNSVLAVTSGGENAQFPLSNLKNTSPALKFRSTGNTVTVVVDTQVLGPVDTIALVGDPTGSLGVSAVTVKSSVTLDFSLSTPINLVLSSEFNASYNFITETADRYWQLECTGTGGFVELSNIFIGQRINLAVSNYSISSFSYRYNDNSTIRRNEYGQHFVDERNLSKKLRGTLEYLSKDEMVTVDDMFKVHGRNKPLWVIVDDSNFSVDDSLYRLSIYGFMTRYPTWTVAGGQHWTATMTVQEAI
jgi:hypothetical protein